MNHMNLPEFDCLPGEEGKAKVMRPSIGGKETYKRIPIRRRQLKHEISNFCNWVLRITRMEDDLLKKQPGFIPFFAQGQTALLITALDRDEYIQAEIGTEEQLNKLREQLISAPLINEESKTQNND